MGGLGKEGDFYMYHWIEDKNFLKNMRSLCSGIVNELVQNINNDSVMTVSAYMVGSGARNMETQNAHESIDLDYNLNIDRVHGLDINRDTNKIKDYIMEMFNSVLSKHGWSNCQDSTSALTTERRHFKEGNQTEFSIDLAIVAEDRDGAWFRLIHEKTGFVQYDRWYWNKSPQSKGLNDKVDWLKTKNLWLEVRETYLTKKNRYLSRGDRNHPSFNCYIEAVNEVFNKYR